MTKKRVLVIEDEGLTASLVSDLLAAEGYEAKVVSNPESALDRALQFRPDLIISDIDMPKVSGFELARNFRKHVALQNVPLVLLTSMVTREVMLTARQLGVREVFSKRGLDADQLRERLHRVLDAPPPGETGQPDTQEAPGDTGAAPPEDS